MTGLAATDDHGGFTGLRRFDVRHDLDAVARLIDITFAEEMAVVGGFGEDSIRSLSRYVPLVWATSLFSRRFRDIFVGFVWEVDGEIVGNASVSRLGGDAKRWMIGNVAVHPSYRRRHIARRLTWAAVEFIRESGGRWAFLDVRHDNHAAYNLYLDMGFHKIDSYMEMRLDRIPPVTFVSSADRTIRRSRAGDWQGLYDLACATTPQGVQAVMPVRKEDFCSNPVAEVVGALQSLLGLSRKERHVMEVGGVIVGALEITLPGSSHPCRFSLTTLPALSTNQIDELIRFALSRVKPKRGRIVIAEVSTGNVPAIEVLTKHGFVEARTLHRFVREIVPT